MREKFITLRLGSHMISHGYDSKNKEILEEVTVPFSSKLLVVSRTKSGSEKYVLTDYLDGRWI